MKILELFRKQYLIFYESYLRKKIKNDSFSIISSNCAGGVIYHRLNKQFLSPTINLFIDNKEFINFVSNLNYYLSLELEFCDSVDQTYPVAKLGDITINFNHYKSNLEAKTKWKERVSRVNYSNLFVLMYDRDGVTKEDLLSLSKLDCRGVAVLSTKKYNDIDYVYTYKPSSSSFSDSMAMNKTKILGKYTFEKYFDYIEWLNN